MPLVISKERVTAEGVLAEIQAGRIRPIGPPDEVPEGCYSRYNVVLDEWELAREEK